MVIDPVAPGLENTYLKKLWVVLDWNLYGILFENTETNNKQQPNNILCTYNWSGALGHPRKATKCLFVLDWNSFGFLIENIEREKTIAPSIIECIVFSLQIPRICQFTKSPKNVTAVC